MKLLKIKETFYDANQAPERKTWMKLSDAEQIRLVRNYLALSERPTVPTKAQILTHVLLEKELATGHGPTIRALSHIIRQGKTRYEAIKELMPLLTEFLASQATLLEPEKMQQLQKAYNQKLLELTTEIKP